MFKRKKESKFQKQSNKVKEMNGINNTLRSKNMNIMKNKKSVNSQSLCKNLNTRKKIKLDTLKSEKGMNKLDELNVKPQYTREMCEYQIQQLKSMPIYPILTQEELHILSMKYKIDGHYRMSENLPPFTSLSGKQFKKNEGTSAYEQMQYVPNYNTQKIKPKNNGTISETSSVETWNTYNTLHTNFGCNLLDNRLEDKYIYTDQSSTNHLCMNQNMEPKTTTNVLSNMQNLAQSRPASDTRSTFDLQAEHFSSGFMNAGNIAPNEYQMYRNLYCNASDSIAQNENLCCSNDLPLQKGTQILQKSNDYSLNSNCYMDCNMPKWSDVASNNKSNTYHSWQNEQSIYIPPIINLESYGRTKNSAIIHPDSFDHTNFVHSSNGTVHPDYNTNFDGTSDHFSLETNTFTPLSSTLNNGYN